LYFTSFFYAKSNLVLCHNKKRPNLEKGSICEDLSSSSEAMEEAAVPSCPRPENGELEAVICASGASPLNPSASFQCSLICSNQPQGGSLTSIEIYSGLLQSGL